MTRWRASRPRSRAAARLALTMALTLLSGTAAAQNTMTISVSPASPREGQPVEVVFTASPTPTVAWTAGVSALIETPWGDATGRYEDHRTSGQAAAGTSTIRIRIPVVDNNEYHGSGEIRLYTGYSLLDTYTRSGIPLNHRVRIDDNDPKPVISVEMGEEAATEGSSHVVWFKSDGCGSSSSTTQGACASGM